MKNKLHFLSITLCLASFVSMQIMAVEIKDDTNDEQTIKTTIPAIVAAYQPKSPEYRSYDQFDSMPQLSSSYSSSQHFNQEEPLVLGGLMQNRNSDDVKKFSSALSEMPALSSLLARSQATASGDEPRIVRLYNELHPTVVPAAQATEEETNNNN